MLPPGSLFRTGVNAEAREAVRLGLRANNSERSGELRRLYASEGDCPKPVEVYLSAADGTVLGGAFGVVRWRWFDLDTVWLSETVRGGGAGRDLLERIEAAARNAGASAVRLDTVDFQARGFYEKCGYRVYGELARYPESHTLFLLTKEL